MTAVVRWIALAGALLGLATALPAAAGEGDGTVNYATNGYATNGNGNGVYPVIEIWKAQRKLQFRQNGTVMEYRVVLGSQPRDGKRFQGDGRTPVGRYYISDKNPDSRFHRFLGISYPNDEDAEHAYRSQLIGVEQWADIFLANVRGTAPPWHTALGGRVGIHGAGGRPNVAIDWTQGCIAVSDEDIEFIFDHTPIGAPVIINE